MSRKGEVQQRCRASSSPERKPLSSAGSTANMTATNKDRDAAIEAAMKESPPDIATQFRTLRRRRWVGAVCLPIVTVALIKPLP